MTFLIFYIFEQAATDATKAETTQANEWLNIFCLAHLHRGMKRGKKSERRKSEREKKNMYALIFTHLYELYKPAVRLSPWNVLSTGEGVAERLSRISKVGRGGTRISSSKFDDAAAPWGFSIKDFEAEVGAPTIGEGGSEDDGST